MNKLIITANNIEQAVDTFGNPLHTAIFLIVGAGAVRNFYPDFFCKELADNNFYVIRYDLRDYGKSTHFKDVDQDIINNKDLLEKKLPYKITDFVHDAKSILQHLDLKSANVVGHSMGGVIAQLFTVLFPNRIKTLTSISSPPAAPPAPSNQLELENRIPKETLDILFSNKPTGDFDTDKDGWIKSFKLLNGELSFDEKMALDYIQSIYNNEPSPDVAWNHIAAQQLLKDYNQKFEKNIIPTLIIHGEKDLLAPVLCAKKTKQMISKSKLHIMPGAGHMFFNRNIWDDILQLLLRHVK